jgi:Domain of unknown function (DUF4396)
LAVDTPKGYIEMLREGRMAMTEELRPPPADSGHGEHHRHAEPPPVDSGRQLTRTAVSATLHCLTGCAIGEVLGMILATWWGWSDAPSIALAVLLAFFFGYLLTVGPVMRSGVALGQAVKIALAADTLSIATMELVDNGVLLVVPGAMEAGLADVLFWSSLAFSLAVAFVVTVPVNRWLIGRGRGHAVAHAHH